VPPRKRSGLRKVFLSSTAKDLGPYRAAVRAAIDLLDEFKCIGMEDFGARDGEADEFCRRRVSECQVFVGLIGHLYGDSPPDRETSFTEREYEAAVEAGLPRLLFLASDHLQIPPSLREPDEKWRRQLEFRARIRRERVIAFFDRPDPLATQVVAALRHLESEERPPARRPASPRRGGPRALPRLFDRSDSHEFPAAVTPLLERAQRVTLIGTGLNLLQRDPLRWELFERAARGDCQVEILLADPQSPAVEARLVEEELGTVKPPVGRSGLLYRLESLLKHWRDLGRPASISIRLFANYPTFALLIVDREYFLYPYAYATLGNFSPVLRLSRDEAGDRGWIEFLDHHARLVKAAAVDAETAFAVRKATAPEDSFAANLVPFALFFVPPEDSGLYRFGSEVLGYDVHGHKSAPSPWPEMVGEAGDFGFHLTVCDSLYFLNEEEVRQAVAEVEYLCAEIKPFELTKLQIHPGFPQPGAFALLPEDSTGHLELLHHELVQRVYRRAAASNYTLGRVGLGRDADLKRAHLMLWRYRAPYILGRFRPHFTLLTRVPEERRDEVGQALAERFRDAGCGESIRVERLAVLSRPSPEAPWVIRQEIRLGREGMAPP